MELLGGEKVPMGSLKIGDRVKTLTAEGRVVYSPVVTFLDQMPDYGGTVQGSDGWGVYEGNSQPAKLFIHTSRNTNTTSSPYMHTGILAIVLQFSTYCGSLLQAIITQ